MALFNMKAHVKACAAMSALGVKANDMAHALGVAALAHARDTGDIRGVDAVYKAMLEGRLRAAGFRVWVRTFAPILWNGDDECKLIPKDNKQFIEYNVDEAEKHPFWTLEAATERVPVQLTAAALRAMIDRYVARVALANDQGEIVAKDGTVTAVIPKDELGTLKTFAQRLKLAADLTDPASEVAKQFRLIKGGAHDVAGAVAAAIEDRPLETAIEQAA